MNSIPCSVCGEGGHPSRRCPTLCEPLKSGFVKPSGGHQHSDEDDESAKKNSPFITTKRVCHIQDYRNGVLL